MPFCVQLALHVDHVVESCLFNALDMKHLLQEHENQYSYVSVFDGCLPLVYDIMIWNYKSKSYEKKP